MSATLHVYDKFQHRIIIRDVIASQHVVILARMCLIGIQLNRVCNAVIIDISEEAIKAPHDVFFQLTYSHD